MEQKIHKYQKEILKKLALNPSLNFNSLLIEGLESEHMNYHLQKLVKMEWVTKKDDKYTLTDLGKDYINSTDDDVITVEKLPKVSVIVNAMRENPEGETEYLLNRRLKQPYYGKVGRMGGKVRFGESVLEAAKRELKEESGLEAKEWFLYEIYRKMRHRKNGEFVQDVIFYLYKATDLVGDLIEKSELQENFWVTEEGARDNLDLYDDMEFVDEMDFETLNYRESVGTADGY